MSPLCALTLLLAAFAPGSGVPGVEPAVAGRDGSTERASPDARDGAASTSAAPVSGAGAVRPAFEPGLAHEVQRLRAAAELRALGRFAEAAAIYEELYDARAESGLLLAAARTRAAAGQHAHALAYLSQLVASGTLTAAETQVAYSELQMAQRSVTPVTVRAQMPLRSDEAPPRLRAEFLAQTTGEQRPPLEFALPSAGVGSTQAVIVQLDPGPWRLRVDEPGLAHIDLLVEVSELPGPALQLDLRPPAEGLPQPQRRRLVGALAGLGGVTLAAGAGVTVVYEFMRLRPALAGPCDDEACDTTLAAAVTGRSFGAALAGAGGGVLVGGLTGSIADPRQRRRAWIFELVLGAAGIAGGSFAVALAARGVEGELGSAAPWGDPDHMRSLNLRVGQHTLAAAGLGLSSGLVFGAAVGLVRTRIYHQRQRRLSLAPSLPRGGFGLALAGRF